MTRQASKVSRDQRGIIEGYRSGLEEDVAEQFTERGLPTFYETETLTFEVPAQKRRYTPDFPVERKDGSRFFVETKGRFTTSDRMKHLHFKKSRPDIEIRFVFNRSKTPIKKGSKTTYAMWCEKNGFLFADKLIPDEWFEE